MKCIVDIKIHGAVWVCFLPFGFPIAVQRPYICPGRTARVRAADWHSRVSFDSADANEWDEVHAAWRSEDRFPVIALSQSFPWEVLYNDPTLAL
jgi:hypothetical protein